MIRDTMIFTKYPKQARCILCNEMSNSTIRIRYNGLLRLDKFICYRCIEELTIPLYECELCSNTIFDNSYEIKDYRVCKECFDEYERHENEKEEK